MNLHHLLVFDDLKTNLCSSSAILTHLPRSWAILGPSRAILGRLGADLGPSWAVLGPSWAILGPSWGLLGAVMGLLGAISAPSFELQDPQLRNLDNSCCETSTASKNCFTSRQLDSIIPKQGCGRSLRAAKLNPAALRQELHGAVTDQRSLETSDLKLQNTSSFLVTPRVDGAGPRSFAPPGVQNDVLARTLCKFCTFSGLERLLTPALRILARIFCDLE